MKIKLQPSGAIDNRILDKLKYRFSSIFGCPVSISSQPAIPEDAYDAERQQYRADIILKYLDDPDQQSGEICLGVVDEDIYAEGLNFIFGLADKSSRKAIISLKRLHQEYYGLSSNDALFLERAEKEAVHELGHITGLDHCTDSKCIMHFSNSLQDTDYKTISFCINCHPRF